MKRAIFPLPLVLFPGGITKLRIFEQRYLRMIRESAGDVGFALTTYDKHLPHNTSQFGSLVKVVDFQTLEDGILGIDIQAEKAVLIGDIEVDADKLCHAELSEVGHWQHMPHSDTTSDLAERLSKLLNDNQSLAQMYPKPELEHPTWVCARWIELLPILPEQKLHFFNPASYQEAVSLLDGILLAKN